MGPPPFNVAMAKTELGNWISDRTACQGPHRLLDQRGATTVDEELSLGSK
jgi:hypothetical protein